MTDKSKEVKRITKEYEEIYENVIKISADAFLFTLDVPPNGLKEIMASRKKRLKMLYFLYGVVDCAVREKIEMENFSISNNNTEDVHLFKWRHKQIQNYFINILGYPSWEVSLISVTLADVSLSIKKSALSYDNPNELRDLTYEGGDSFLRLSEPIDKKEKIIILQYLNLIRYGKI